MRKLSSLVAEAIGLPDKQKRELINQLRKSLARPRRRTGARRRKNSRRALAEFIAMSGTAHSDYTDVSSNKYRHLGEIYAPKR